MDIDSAEIETDDRGRQIRSTLIEHTDLRAIPQIFMGGELVGDCTDLFAFFREGRMQQLLREEGIDFVAERRAGSSGGSVRASSYACPCQHLVDVGRPGNMNRLESRSARSLDVLERNVEKQQVGLFRGILLDAAEAEQGKEYNHQQR